MSVEPLGDPSLECSVLNLGFGLRLPDVTRGIEQRDEITFGFAHLADQSSGDCFWTSAENELISCRLDGCSDPGQMVEQVAGENHTFASEPGGTSPSVA
jgi:hypothetical protein